MMSLKTMPGCGKSGTSRILAFRSSTPTSLPASVPEIAPEEQLRELLGQLGQGLQLLDGRLPALRVARAERGRHELLEQPGLSVGGGAEGAQMPCRDAEARELRTGDRDVHVAGRVQLLAPYSPRLEQPVLLELARELGRDRSALAELPEVELVVLVGQPDRPPAAALLARARRRRKLLADHAQRQELVALEPQDRLQALDVVLAEEPVAALRAPRCEQPLVLEVADLRDRDVRELGLQPRGRPCRSSAAAPARVPGPSLISPGSSACTCRSGARRRSPAGRTRCGGG